jgi:hypothetical protein
MWQVVYLELYLVHLKHQFLPQKKQILLSITNKMQRYTIFFITVNALHVLGGFSAHHQELKICTHSIWYMSNLLTATASVGELFQHVEN